MALTKAQKLQALEEYNTNVQPISEKRLDWCVKQSARYIYTDKKNGIGFCTKCEKKVMLPKTKHLQKMKCPSCNKEMQILHIGRREWLEDNVDWYVFPEAMSEDMLRLRYVYVVRSGKDPEPSVRECARMVIDFGRRTEHTFELTPWEETWKYQTMNYFRERDLGIDYRRFCCLAADIYPYGLGQIKKLKVFKNFKFTKDMFKNFYVSSCLGFMSKRMDLYEKLSEVGLNNLIHDDLYSYWHDEIKYNSKETSLTKMLGIDKLKLRLLKEYPTRNALKVMQKYPVNEKNISYYRDLEFDTYAIESIDDIVKEYKLKPGKVKNYILSIDGDYINSKVRDYANYLYKLRFLEYPFDNSYCYPKDYKKDKARIENEYSAKQNALRYKATFEKIKKESSKVKVIKTIARYIKENEKLMSWMQGSQGLKVIVPETPDELYREGIALHNCLAKYAEKIADKESLVFFIHKIDDPDKAFVAMEYKNGEINSLMYNGNVRVDDEKIISFATAFANKLKEIKIEKHIKKVA